VSDNITRLTGIEPDRILNDIQYLHTLLNVDKESAIVLCEEGIPLRCNFSHLQPTSPPTINNFSIPSFPDYLVFVHSSRISPIREGCNYQGINKELNNEEVQFVVVEAEIIEDPVVPSSRAFHSDDILFQVNAFSLHLSTAETLKDMCSIIAREVQRASGYDRIMVYEFDAGECLIGETIQQ
jgi:hypothetical protein